MRSLRTLLVAVLAIGLLVPLVPAAADGHTVTSETVESFDGTNIEITVYQPAGASAENPAPVILHSHGWGGSRTTSATAFGSQLGRGFGVVSISQRGFGGSGGKANVMDPELEGQDMIAVIDHVAEKDWVRVEQTEHFDRDPVLFAIGGSYGGGYQFLAALTEIRDFGATRLDAIAPDMTWFNLSRSLAPEGVVRSAWAAALYAAGAANIVEYVHPAFAYGLSTGQWPDGTVPGIHNLDEEFFRHGPSGFVAQGIHLDIPALIMQGASDNLFNLNEGLHNFHTTLTEEARTRSAFVGYNGGHALPNAAPIGFASGSDACGVKNTATELAFFEAVMAGGGAREVVGSTYALTDAFGDCLRTDVLDSEVLTTGHDVQVTSGTLTTTGAGAPQHLELAQGPITVAGIPELEATVTTAGADQRVFFALSVGATPLTAQVVQNNMMPLRELLPIVQEARTVELPGVAVDVPEGQNLYLTVTALSDMSFGHGSVRTPGVVGLEDIRVHVPVIRDTTEIPAAARTDVSCERGAAVQTPGCSAPRR
jgi:ABC-2 type transport system ATP-binding protein